MAGRCSVLVVLLAGVPMARSALGQTCFDLGVLAGRGVGDGGPGAQAVLRSPRQLALDASGGVLIADGGNARVRRWDAASGVVTTIAGNGAPLRGTEGAPAVLASFEEPDGLAVANRVVYIADGRADTVWKVGADGILTRFAGTGITTGAIDGDNPGKPGNDPTDDLNDGQLAIFATLNTPVRLAIDPSGGLLISDLGNGRIRRVDFATGRMSTVAKGFTRPVGLAVGASTTIYVADPGANRIFRLQNGDPTPFAGNGTAGDSGDEGPATDASLNGAADISIDASGVVYIGDTLNNVVRKVTADGKIHRVAGDGNQGFREGPGALSRFDHPVVLAGPGGVVYVADTDNNRLRKYDTVADATSTLAGGDNALGDGGPAAAAILDRPTGLAINGQAIYLSEHDSHRVRQIDGGGTIRTVVNRDGTNGSPPDGSVAFTAPLKQPTGIAIAANGDVLIADAQDHRVVRVDAGGVLHSFAGKVSGGEGVAGKGGENEVATSSALDTPLRVAVASDGSVFITDFNNDRIRRVDGNGRIATVVGTTRGFSDGPAATAQLNQPSGLVFDGAGNLYIADFGNHVVRKVDPAGNVTRVAGTPATAGDAGDGGAANAARLDGPTDLAIAHDGALLVVDQLNNKVKRISPAADGTFDGSGVITTILGNGQATFANGPGPRASLLIPTDVAVDARGNVLVADRGNQLVRIATPGANCNVAPGRPCATNADCNDGDPCTTDVCQPGGVCRYDLVHTPECQPACDREPHGCIPGGGPRRTDCLAETLVRAPLSLRGAVPKPVVRCHQGDPSCDFDNVPGQCTFRVAWCLNEKDARIGCSAAGVARLSAPGSVGDLLVRATLQLAPQGASQAGRAVVFSPAYDTSDSCTGLTQVPVALKKKGRRPGTLTMRVMATSAGRPRRRDADTVKLICLP